MAGKAVVLYKMPTPTMDEVVRNLVPLIRNVGKEIMQSLNESMEKDGGTERRRMLKEGERGMLLRRLDLSTDMEEIKRYVRAVKEEDLASLLEDENLRLTRFMLAIPEVVNRLPGRRLDDCVRFCVITHGNDFTYAYMMVRSDAALGKLSEPYFDLLVDYLMGVGASMMLESEIGKTRLSESQKASLENRAGIKQGEVRSEIMNRLDSIRLSGEM